MNAITTPTVTTFDFHGDQLSVITWGGQPFVAMRQIVESMGLIWAAQTVKFNTNKARWGVSMIETPSAGGKQVSLCIPLRKLSGWLSTLNPNKVKAELREKVIAYQNECDDALWEYWSSGIAVRQSFAPGPRDVLTASQAEQLRLAMNSYAARLPKEQQGPFMKKGWSKLKSHFGVTYRQIPQMELTEALSVIGRHGAQWEVVDALPAPTSGLTAMQLEELGAMCEELQFMGSWWNKFGPAIDLMNPTLYGRIFERFLTAPARARHLCVELKIPLRSREYYTSIPWNGDDQASFHHNRKFATEDMHHR